MRYYHYLLGFIIMSGICASCIPSVLIQDSYEKKNIVIPHYYIYTYENHIMSVSIYAEYIDSIFTQFSNKLSEFELDIEISDNARNKISDSLWKSKQRMRFYNHNKIDESYIAKSVPKKDVLYLIPYIHYTDSHNYQAGKGNSYHVHIGISLYLIENNKIIYSMSYQNKTKSIPYDAKEEIDRETMRLYVDKLWEELMKKVLYSYIERLE